MIDWSIRNKDMIIDEWGYSDIEEYQKKREILNKAICAYNDYITGIRNDLSEVVGIIKSTEIKLSHTCFYSVTIKKMKKNLDYIVNKDGEGLIDG